MSIFKDTFIALKHIKAFKDWNAEPEQSYPIEKKPKGDTEKRVLWFFINGIMTTRSDGYEICHLLGRAFGATPILLYNPTKGLHRDLLECVYQRSLDGDNSVVRKMTEEVKGALDDGYVVRVISHSQGTIIASLISERLKNYAGLEMYTFAGAFDEFPEGAYYAEHFWNANDYVAKIGIGEFHPVHGKDYCGPFSGHKIGRHYMPHFVNGQYCNGDSKLWNFLKGG